MIFVYGFYYFAILKRNRLTAFSDSLLKSQKNQDSNANLPAVSIIVSTFNEASVIERKIGNLSTLSYPQNLMEIIVYDDASNDETGSIATKALKENNLYGKVIINPHRLGLNRSLNMAIAEAKYNFICITDSDVILEKDALKNAVEVLQQYKNAGGVTGHIQPVFESEGITQKSETSYRGFYHASMLSRKRHSLCLSRKWPLNSLR